MKQKNKSARKISEMLENSLIRHWEEEENSVKQILCEMEKYVGHLKEIVYHDLEADRREDFNEYIDASECIHHLALSEEYRKGIYDAMVLKDLIKETEGKTG